MKRPPRISLVCTARDEVESIAALLDSMLAQTRMPDEIVVNDCASRDATPEIVASYIAAGHPIRLVRGGHNIPSGRNNAIRHACGELIACTDAGLTLDRHWLERIVAPLERDEADVVGGFFRPAPRSLFELVLGATNYRDVAEIDQETFLPFGKSVAFRKQAWERVSGYPEWASHSEDLLFDLALKRMGYRFAFAPDALVLFRPRSSLRAFARQYFLYARGDGVANLWPRRHAIRYLTYATTAAILILARRRPWLLALPALGGLAYVRAPLRRLALTLRLRSGHAPQPPLPLRQERGRAAVARTGWKHLGTRAIEAGAYAMAAALIPVIRLTGDLAKMAGYPVGVLRRLRSPELRAAIREYGRIEPGTAGEL